MNFVGNRIADLLHFKWNWGFGYDLAWAALAPILAILLRNDFFLTPEEMVGMQVYVLISFLTSLLFFRLFFLQLDLWKYTSLKDIVRITLAVSASVVVATFIMFVVNRHAGVARSIPLIHYLILLFVLLSSRVLSRLSFRSTGKNDGWFKAGNNGGQQSQHVLLVGVSALAELYVKASEQMKEGNIEILGVVTDNTNSHGKRLWSYPVLGFVRLLPHFLNEFSVRGIVVDKIIVCTEKHEMSRDSIQVLEQLSRLGTVQVEFIEELLGFFTPPVKQVRQLEKQDLEDEIAEPSSQLSIQVPVYHKVKRILDMAVVLPLAVFSSPFILALAIANRVSIGKPVLFWQKRYGRRGWKFKVYKFRTMLVPYDDVGNRVPDDQRQTQLTRLVRRSRLDEFPQLYNILTGQMSLIGPRPLLLKDQPKGYAARLVIPPGVTGWAQVNGGEALSREEKLAMDVWYVFHAGVLLDIKIILLTLLVVLKGDRRNDETVLEATTELRTRYPSFFTSKAMAA